jgi:esterase/lipase
VRAVRVATLVLVAEHDEIVPTALSQRVYDAAAGPKRWVALAASHHNDRALFGGPQVIAEVDRWLSAL